MDSNSNVNANNKRSANDVNEHQDHANTKRTKSTKVDLRFLLASRTVSLSLSLRPFLRPSPFIAPFLGDAGAIIGRQGKNIQMLRSKYKTVIQVPVSDRSSRWKVREREVSIAPLGSTGS